MSRALTLNTDNVIEEQIITAAAVATVPIDNVLNSSGATIAACQAVNITNTGSPLAMTLADSSSTGDLPVDGFTVTGVLMGDSGQVQKFGPLDGFSGLTPATNYYHDPSTPGAIVTTATNTAGEKLQQVGWAMSATTLVIEIHEPLERI